MNASSFATVSTVARCVMADTQPRKGFQARPSHDGTRAAQLSIRSFDNDFTPHPNPLSYTTTACRPTPLPQGERRGKWIRIDFCASQKRSYNGLLQQDPPIRFCETNPPI